ncbi:MAG: hypothetical protein DMG54_29200 [Acidobacteria bacterium]|nr:MAG: hypothetical protein DMG53_28440 [Acidobacteriota bacterium]PYU38757.1 MAG: hypothetical protein DMG54_29200 [Acidobacteriota bacterium]PYU71540.1 MAG: hypothetical protein DMG52_22110 [Acidobacteriota bacterium]
MSPELGKLQSAAKKALDRAIFSTGAFVSGDGPSELPAVFAASCAVMPRLRSSPYLADIGKIARTLPASYPVLVHRLPPLLHAFFRTSPRGSALALRYHFTSIWY